MPRCSASRTASRDDALPRSLPRHPEALATGRLVLEPLDAAHAERLFADLADPALYRYIPTEPYATVDGLRERYAHVARGPSAPDERWWNWALVTRDGPRRALGTVELSLAHGGRTALLAYALGRAHWGCGYAFEACVQALAYLRARAGPCEVEAYVDTRNARSIALVERLGFARKGYVANADYFKGSPSDEYVFGIALHEVDDAETPGR